jgi:hypothetical protein
MRRFMFAFLKPLLRQNRLTTLLQVNVGACTVIFLLLQWWRPCFFLTDDNLSAGFPVFTEIGRHLKSGQSPFVSDCLFGGHYNLLRDVSYLTWHPIWLASSLLADTPAKFWIVDIPAYFFLVLAAGGFTVLIHSLREEFRVDIPDIYLVFYTMSYVFSNYILTVGSSWLSVLGNQSALPWLVLGILDKKMLRGAVVIMVFTVHELLGGYIGLTVSTGLILSLFSAGVVLYRRSPAPLLAWCAGNVLALFALFPFLSPAIDGFLQAPRLGGYTLLGASAYNIPANVVTFSFFAGHWNEPVLRWGGDPLLKTLEFPYAWSLLACAAAWCIVPALFGSARWKPLEVLCLWICMILVVCIIRPDCVTLVMHLVPIVRVLRWPFREALQLLFFVHLFLALRSPGRLARWQPAIALWSLFMFLAPLPWVRVPSLNPLALDRQLVFSGAADKFWAQVKTRLKPTDEVATVIGERLWFLKPGHIPYALAGTANFSAYFQFIGISGYSQTAPLDQVPLKTVPFFWFGAFKAEQMNDLWAQRPHLKIIQVMDASPLKISLLSKDAPPIDLTPYLPPLPD